MSFKNYEDIWNNLEAEWLNSDFYIDNESEDLYRKFSLIEIFDYVCCSSSDSSLYDADGEWAFPLSRAKLFEIGLGDMIKEYEKEEFGDPLQLKYEYKYDETYEYLEIDDGSPYIYDQFHIYIATTFQQIWDKIRFEDNLIFLDYDCYRPEYNEVSHGEDNVWFNVATNYYLASFLTYNSAFLLDYKNWLKKHPLLKENFVNFSSDVIINKIDDFIERNNLNKNDKC